MLCEPSRALTLSRRTGIRTAKTEERTAEAKKEREKRRRYMVVAQGGGVFLEANAPRLLYGQPRAVSHHSGDLRWPGWVVVLPYPPGGSTQQRRLTLLHHYLPAVAGRALALYPTYWHDIRRLYEVRGLARQYNGLDSIQVPCLVLIGPSPLAPPRLGSQTTVHNGSGW